MTDPIREGSKIFLELAQNFGNQVDKTEQIDRFFTDLLKATQGLVIVDFLDAANWDKIETYSFNRDSKNLSLIWHDYRNEEECEEETNLRRLIFPGEVYELHIKLKSIEIIRGKSSCIFLLNGYATEDKELKKLYGHEADEFHFDSESFFSKRIYKNKNGEWSVIRAHHTPLYSIAILPKNCGFSSFDSKKILYLKNYQACEERLQTVISELEKLDENCNEDAICEKANTIRRILENILKIECSFHELVPKKSYSHLRLGDLINYVKEGKEEAEIKILNYLVISLNRLSHDSGYPVEKHEAQAAALLTLGYLKLRPFETKYNDLTYDNYS